MLASMTLEEKAGQVFCPMGFTDDPDALAHMIRDTGVGAMMYRTGPAAYIQNTHRTTASSIMLVIAAFYAIAEHADQYRSFVNCWGVPNPLPNVTQFPPTLSIHGTSDLLVDYAREVFAQKAFHQAEVKNKLITLEGEGHTPLGKYEEFIPEILKWLGGTYED